MSDRERAKALQLKLKLRAQLAPAQDADDSDRRSLGMEAVAGFNRGLAEFIDVLADPVAMGLRKAGVDVPRDPAQTLFAETGMTPAPQSRAGEIVQRFAAPTGGAAVPFGGLTSMAARQGTRAAAPIIRAMAGRPAAATGAEIAAAVGAGTGAVVGSELGGPAGEAVGAIAGGLAPAGVAGTARRLFRGAPNRLRNVETINPATGRPETVTASDDIPSRIGAFERHGVPYSAGQIGGTVPARTAEAIAGATPLGGSVVSGQFAERQQNRLAEAVTGVVREISPSGGVPSATEAGGALREGAEGFADRLKARTDALYAEVDALIPPKTPIGVDNTVAALRELTTAIPGAEATTGAEIAPGLVRMAENLSADLEATGTIPYEALKALRTRIGERIGSPTLAGDDIRTGELRRLYAAMSEDMGAAATAQGPRARAMWERANALFARGQSYVERELAPAVKALEDEKIFTALERGNRDGATKLNRMRQALTPDQWRAVSAAVVNRLGRATRSAQDETGQAFSSETFLSSWSNFSPEARRALFPNRAHRAAMDELTTMAARIREGSRGIGSLYNPSGTAGNLANVGAVVSALTVPGAAGPIATAAGAGAAGVKLLTWTPFVRWLAQTTRVPVSQFPRQMERLGALAEDDAFGADVAAYMDGLNDRLGLTQDPSGTGRREVSPSPAPGMRPR